MEEHLKKIKGELEAKIDSMSIVKLIQEYYPSTRFETETNKGILFQKAFCLLNPVGGTKIPDLYVRPDCGLYRCFNCGQEGGIVSLLELVGLDTDAILSRIDYHGKQNKKLIEEMLGDISGFEKGCADINFDYAYLAEKSLMPDGTWEKPDYLK